MDYVIDLLQRHLDNLEHDLKRSKDQNTEGEISDTLHKVYI